MTKTGASARPDLEERTDSAMDWIRLHSRQLTIAAIAMAAVVGGGWLYARSRSMRAERGDQALSAARATYASGNIPLAQSDLQKLVTRYRGTAAGAQGKILLARVLFEQGKTDEGLKVLDEAGGSEVGPEVTAMRAAGLEQKGQYAQAADRYLEASRAAEKGPSADSYRADAARAFALAGKGEQARQIWAELAADKSSFYAAEARIRLGELAAKPAGKA